MDNCYLKTNTIGGQAGHELSLSLSISQELFGVLELNLTQMFTTTGNCQLVLDLHFFEESGICLWESVSFISSQC